MLVPKIVNRIQKYIYKTQFLSIFIYVFNVNNEVQTSAVLVSVRQKTQ